MSRYLRVDVEVPDNLVPLHDPTRPALNAADDLIACVQQSGLDYLVVGAEWITDEEITR